MELYVNAYVSKIFEIYVYTSLSLSLATRPGHLTSAMGDHPGKFGVQHVTKAHMRRRDERQHPLEHMDTGKNVRRVGGRGSGGRAQDAPPKARAMHPQARKNRTNATNEYQ